MERRHLPLLLASERFASDAETEPLDRLRMQKGVFLLEMRGPRSWKSLYQFSPYDWGPFSRQLVSDIDTLMVVGELTLIRFEGFRYGEYRTTDKGEEDIAPVLDELDDRHQRFIRSVRGFVTTRAFSQLLRDVYGEYPEYATQSRFSG